MKHITLSRFSMTALLAASLLASGCSMNPYVRTTGLESSLPAETNASGAFYGDLPGAIKDVDVQRSAFLDELKTRTVQRNLLSGSLIGLTAGALYQGVNSAAGSSARSVANFGAAAGGAYALGDYSNSPPTELAYINAANDLTCLVLRTRPWLIKDEDYKNFKHAVYDLLSATNAMDALYQRQVAQSGDKKEFLKSTRFEREMHAKARTTLRKASNFDGFITTAGFQLKQQARLVNDVANFEIHRNQRDLVNPGDALTGLRSTSQAFRDIKPLDVTPAKEQEDKAGDETTSESGTQEAPKTDKAPVIATKTKTDASPTSATASSDLGKQADTVVKDVAALNKELKEEKKANSKQTDITIKQLTKLAAELKSLTHVVTALNATQTATLTVVVSRLDTRSAEQLALSLSDLLAAMRPVNAVLTRAYSLKPYVKNIPECQPLNAQAFEFAFDADEVELSPGQTFDVALKGGVGIPRIWLSGAKGTDKADTATLTTTIDGGIARARLKLTTEAPAGEIHIMAIDGSGKQKDDIKVIVVKPEPPKK